MDIKPILSALGRHRVAAALIVLEIALACAVLCNAFFLISSRLELMRIDSGVQESAVGTITLNGCDGCSNADLNARVLGALRAIPGVRAAGAANSTPFGQRAGYMGASLDQEDKQWAGVLHFYMADAAAIEALGLRPVQGNPFAASDFQPIDNFVPSDAPVWVTRALAEHLWPGESPLGKELWSGAHFRVTGVVDSFAVTDPGRSEEGVAGAQWSVIVPVRDDAQSGSYVLRADPLDLPRVMQAARQAVARAVPEAVLDQQQSRTLSELRERYFRSDRAMAWLLVAVIAAMLLVTALGIVGLASFWVQQRTKQIGIRRALGATRRQITTYFQTENLLLTGAGIALGMLLAYGGNQVLMHHFEIARLPLPYLPFGALALLLLGQAAVIGPALRAAAVPPIVATRSA